MPQNTKYNQILDALQELLVKKNIQSISVSEIAQTAGIGKGSIYYYFPSKNEILEALIERNYKKTPGDSETSGRPKRHLSLHPNGNDLSGMP